MKIDVDIQKVWERIGEGSQFQYSVFIEIVEKTLDQIELRICDILNNSKTKKIEDNSIDPQLNLQESLMRISSNSFLKSNFEKVLKKNFNIANWFFWLDVTKLIEGRDLKENFRGIQELIQKYLIETSLDEVKNFQIVVL